MDDLTEIKEVAAIKKLKARHCRLLDTKQWDEWRKLFSNDFLSDTANASGGRKIQGGDEFVAFVKGVLKSPKKSTCHQVHMPEIELTSPTTATGIWALEDVVRVSWGLNLQRQGHYHETYEKVDGQWQIKFSKLTRLREDLFNSLFSITLPIKTT